VVGRQLTTASSATVTASSATEIAMAGRKPDSANPNSPPCSLTYNAASEPAATATPAAGSSRPPRSGSASAIAVAAAKLARNSGPIVGIAP
jgi:hypothetical protein